MKLKRITDEEMEKAYHKTISAWRGLELVAQAQLEACEKEATDKVNETLSLIEGYTEMAVREIFEWIEENNASPPEANWITIIKNEEWLTYKQSTLKKYGGEK